MFRIPCDADAETVQGDDVDDLDDLVQGLAVAKYALEAHDERTATAAVDAALATARRLLSESVEEPGKLVRHRRTPH